MCRYCSRFDNKTQNYPHLYANSEPFSCTFHSGVHRTFLLLSHHHRAHTRRTCSMFPNEHTRAQTDRLYNLFPGPPLLSPCETFCRAAITLNEQIIHMHYACAYITFALPSARAHARRARQPANQPTIKPSYAAHHRRRLFCYDRRARASVGVDRVRSRPYIQRHRHRSPECTRVSCACAGAMIAMFSVERLPCEDLILYVLPAS